MMMTVARARGWREHEILWEIPLARLVQYVHAIWSYDTITCHWSCYTGEAGNVKSALERARMEWEQQVELLD